MLFIWISFCCHNLKDFYFINSFIFLIKRKTKKNNSVILKSLKKIHKFKINLFHSFSKTCFSLNLSGLHFCLH